MKDGLIVYLVGDSSLPTGFDVRAASRALGHRAQQVEMVSREEGFFSVEDAWHFLLTRGCGRINLLVAQAEGAERMKALLPAVRLCG